MESIRELRREAAPATRPFGLASFGGNLYVGSLDASALYEIDPATWQVRAEIPAPGKPYGLAVLGGAIRVVVSIGAEDDRHLCTFVPGRGFDDAKIGLPGLSGSHLASNGSRLYLLQIGLRQILELDDDATAARAWRLPQRICGLGFRDGTLYGIAGDEEFEHLQFSRIELGAEAISIEGIASIPDEARVLTHDGKNWWTSYRDLNEVCSFES